MRKLRKDVSAQMYTGGTMCKIDFDHIKGMIVVPRGFKLPVDLTGEKLEELCHADKDRVYGIAELAEYAKNGGEAQVNAVGYGGSRVTGYSDRTDTFTPKDYDMSLYASLTKFSGKPMGVYYFDDKGRLFGINDGTDMLAAIPVNGIYADATPLPTSSDKANMTVSCLLSDTRAAIENADFVELGFNPLRYQTGLVPVVLGKVGATGNSYKLYEKTGGYDCTKDFSEEIVQHHDQIFEEGVTSVAFNEADETLTIVCAAGKTPKFKSASALLAAGIKGIEIV